MLRVGNCCISIYALHAGEEAQNHTLENCRKITLGSATEGRHNTLCQLQSHLLLYNTHTQPFNGPFSGTTRVSWYEKGKTNLDFTEARNGEWQWRQLGHMQVRTSLQTDNHASTPPLDSFTAVQLYEKPNALSI